MKATVKLPKSIKRLLATMDKKMRRDYCRLYVAAMAQDVAYSRRAPKSTQTNDDAE